MPPADARIEVQYNGERLTFVYPGTERAEKVAEIVHEIFVQRVYETPAVRIRPGDVVLDGGAYLGMFTRYALAQKAEGVTAVEPNPIIAPYLRRNVLSNRTDCQACGVVPWALGDVVTDPHKRLHLRVDRLNQASAHVVPDGAGYDRYAHGMTIDDMFDGDLVDFIKLDIEGSELPALKGGEDTISRWRPNLAIALYHNDDAHAIHALLAHWGYGPPQYQGGQYRVGLWHGDSTSRDKEARAIPD